MCLMVMKHFITETIGGVISDKVNAKSFLIEVANQFTKSDKIETITLLGKLVPNALQR